MLKCMASFFHMTLMFSPRWKGSIWKSHSSSFLFIFTAKGLLFGVCLTPPAPCGTSCPTSSGFLYSWLMQNRCFSYLRGWHGVSWLFCFYNRISIFKSHIFASGISQPVKHHGKGFLESTSSHLPSLPAPDSSPNPYLIAVQINALNLRK